MAIGYGLLMSGAAVYLLGGLGVRRALARRAMLARAVAPPRPRPATAPHGATQPQT
jgi:hypothetical protein